jgi:hypothetical protein
MDKGHLPGWCVMETLLAKWLETIWAIALVPGLCSMAIPAGLALFVLIDKKTAPGRPRSPLWILVFVMIAFSTVVLMFLGLLALAVSTWNFGP